MSERKKLVVWLDDDGETHISALERYGEEDNDLLFIIEFAEGEEPIFFSSMECMDEMEVERA